MISRTLGGLHELFYCHVHPHLYMDLHLLRPKVSDAPGNLWLITTMSQEQKTWDLTNSKALVLAYLQCVNLVLELFRISADEPEAETHKTPAACNSSFRAALAQVDWQSGVRLPVLRPVALYITERFRPERLQEVLVPEPREACAPRMLSGIRWEGASGAELHGVRVDVRRKMLMANDVLLPRRAL